MKYAKLATVLVVVFSVGSTALADWDPNADMSNHKMHFPQLPDLSSNGMDVLATWEAGWFMGGEDDEGNPTAIEFGKILADDWQCSGSGPVSDIHIWGSWLNDFLPEGDSAAGGVGEAKNVRFKLSIHKNVPVNSNTVMPWSHPGEQVWSRIFEVGDPQVSVREVNVNPPVQEQFYDPNTDKIVGPDTQVYQYNFLLTNDNLEQDPIFHQTAGEIYWLDVQADPVHEVPPGGTTFPHPPLFGWKTSDLFKYPDDWQGRHFEDDAVYGDNIEFGGPPIPDFPSPSGVGPWTWKDMHYPVDHPLEGQSFDLAFVITPEPATMTLLAIGGLAVLRRRRRS